LLEAFDGAEALELTVRDKPDLIIIDIQLPKMSGLEVTRRLRQIPAFSYIPIIAVTAYAMKGDRENAIEAGCDAYLSKPINTRELPRLVTGMLLRRNKIRPSTNGQEDGEENSGG
jgi:two-component system cell cycle response regulator DivK